MNKRWISKIGALALAACLAMPTLIASADDGEISISFEDVTATDATTQYGEAKIKVSISGAAGNTTVVQNAFSFDGLSYKSVRFLKGENNPPAGVWYSPTDTATVNENKKFTLGIASNSGLTFGDNEEVFVVTFSGEPGDSVTLSVDDDLTKTYCKTGDKQIFAADTASGTATASDKGNKSAEATVKLTMDKVPGFNATADTGITLKLTSETTAGYVITNTLNNTPVQEGGHRESTDIPTFTVTNSVLDGDTYTVELFGAGYVAYKKTGVNFSTPLEITNAEFIPGDVNGDGKVDAEDKKAAEKSRDEEFNEAADFDRNGKTDSVDMAVFDGIKDDSTGGNTGDNTGGGGTGGGGTGGNTGGTTGGTTGGNTTGGSTGGSGGSGGGGGSTGGSFGGGGFTGGTGANGAAQGFVDLEDYAWAKDSVYALKNKGIISGISDTEFAPASNIKRGDFILILTRMLGVNDAFTDNFADVGADTYYYSAIGSAKVAGIAQGSGENFMPEASITRQDLITLAYRAFLAKGYITEAADISALYAFADNGDISDYAQSAMASMVGAGIIQGSNGNVNPKGNATRAEVAVMCARMVELMN